MYHLRTIKNGEETNVELGYEYKKINLAKANGGHWLIDNLAKEIAKRPESFEDLKANPPIFIEIPGQVRPHQVQIDEETYIVDSNGNTYERIPLKYWLDMTNDRWEKMWNDIFA